MNYLEQDIIVLEMPVKIISFVSVFIEQPVENLWINPIKDEKSFKGYHSTEYNSACINKAIETSIIFSISRVKRSGFHFSNAHGRE